ncbi:MAG TPA: response regulator [Methylomirabilota bacterium]|nr:response regulator [Methylomirabilota bacterium]
MTTLTAPLVFLVDDDASVRKSLARLVKTAGYEAELFASVRDFLARAPYDGPCCLVLDVRMPGLTGLDLQEALRVAGQRLSIVFITGHRDVPASVKAMKAGAVDFLTKPVDAETLLAAIRQAVARTLTDRRRQARVAEVRDRIATLTPREAAVFALVVTGMLNKQIGAKLGIAEKTVKVHRARVMEKMQAGSLAELVRLADEGSVMAAGS